MTHTDGEAARILAAREHALTELARLEAPTVNQDATPPHGDFYVTVKDAGRTGFLLGPYADIRDALANVRRASKLAESADWRAAFYAYGVSRAPIGTTIKAVFGGGDA